MLLHFARYLSRSTAIEWWRSCFECVSHYPSPPLHNFLCRDTSGVGGPARVERILYCIVPYRTKYRRTKFFGGQNFRHQVLDVLDFSGQNISADKIFGGQKFSADKIIGSKSDFRQFCPPKFCPIRYILTPSQGVLEYIERILVQRVSRGLTLIALLFGLFWRIEPRVAIGIAQNKAKSWYDFAYQVYLITLSVTEALMNIIEGCRRTTGLLPFNTQTELTVAEMNRYILIVEYTGNERIMSHLT